MQGKIETEYQKFIAEMEGMTPEQEVFFRSVWFSAVGKITSMFLLGDIVYQDVFRELNEYVKERGHEYTRGI